MPIIVNLDIVMAKSKIRSKDLADQLGIKEVNLSILKQEKPGPSAFLHCKHFTKLWIANQVICWNLRNDQAF